MRKVCSIGSFYQGVKLAFLVLFLGLVLYSCVKVPITGRSQLILISQEHEHQLGLVAFEEVVRNERISTDPRYNAAVDRVVRRIAQVSNRPDFDWEYKVIDKDDMVNAFALPGGKLGIYTGILRVAETDAGLATIISHEVAHAVARHGGERLTTGLLSQIGALGLEVALSGMDVDPNVTYGIMQAYGIGVGVGVILPFNRNQESEADRIGLIYMARAGYDPREAISFWQRMADLSNSENTTKLPEFLNTHPDHGTRIANLQKYLPEALDIYKTSNKAPNHLIIH